MASKESNIVAKIMLRASKIGARVWRNNIGVATYPNGSVVKYGVCNPGGSDLIGFTPYKIKPEDVGKIVAIFTAPECKTAKGSTRDVQKNFIRVVCESGGISGICRSPEDYEKLVAEYKPI